jgi:hypothetical protein
MPTSRGTATIVICLNGKLIAERLSLLGFGYIIRFAANMFEGFLCAMTAVRQGH